MDGLKASKIVIGYRMKGDMVKADTGAETERIMQEIREAARNYEARDGYDFDETGKYWKMSPGRSLGTQPSGQKFAKARITAGLTCNADGSDKPPIWFIGEAKRPNCFRDARIWGLESLGAFSRSSSTVWMNNVFFQRISTVFECLCWETYFTSSRRFQCS